MTRLQSVKKIVNKSDKRIFMFLSDFTHFAPLMPDDKVSDFVATADECSFTAKGTGKISLKMIDRRPDSFIKMTDNGGLPIKYYLSAFIEKISEEQATVQFIFEADINPMIKMMIASPINNLLDKMAEKLNDVTF
jgi:carbon monoxide dehydrogenase subunit G